MNEVRKPRVREWKKGIVLVSMIIMTGGLLFSRALLSSAMIVFIAATFINKNQPGELKRLFSPFFLGLGLLFLIPFISGLWSENLQKWLQIIMIKSPLLFLPFCFRWINNFTAADWKKFGIAFIILITIGIIWSLSWYLQDTGHVHAAYLKAGTIKTPIGNDHVRFSLLVTIAIFILVYLLIKERRNLEKIVSILFLILTAFFISYLHILAARTGLICFYTGLFILITWLLVNQRQGVRYSWLLLILFLPLLSWLLLPTFRNRVSYLKYDLSVLQKTGYYPGSNDGNRLLSIRAGWQLMQDHPMAGVGFGDLKNETNTWYDSNIPGMQGPDKFIPCSEWITYGAATGWPGFLLFSVAILLPFFEKKLRTNIAWILPNIFFALSYLFDIGLEVQFGVFLHAFILLWLYKWLDTPERIFLPAEKF